MPVISQSGVLTPSEFRAALAALTRADKVRLAKKAQALSPGTGMEPDDLLNEAILRSLENDGRNCPRNVKLVVFLGNAMRSIASAERGKWMRESPGGATNDDEINPISTAPDGRPRPEEVAVNRIDFERTISRIEEIFADDAQALAVVMGDMEGASPDEVRELEPMSEKEYVAARKRVRRMILREFPRGATNG